MASLYSGGKDSTFSMYLTLQQGHDIPYVVNVVPEDSASWIFHTPNLGVVPLMAESMGRELITGTSSGSEEGDMEGLHRALDGLDVEGVVSGAIWSDYQWDRMNIVCGDLGLKLFAPLWRKDQDMLMDQFLDSGIRAMIVGCYAEGLGEEWLGRIIDREAVEELKKIRSKTGISIMGEGGEYESLTLDSPMCSRPLVVDGCEKDWSSQGGTLRVTSAHLVTSPSLERARPEPSQPKGVSGHCDRGQRHGRGGYHGHFVDKAIESQNHRKAGGYWYAHDVIDECEEQILPYVLQRRLSDLESRRDRPQIAVHQHYIGRFDGYIGAGAYSDAEIGLGERRSIVYPVTGHCDPLLRDLKVLHLIQLVSRHDIRHHGIDADIGGDAFRGAPAVPGHHEDLHSV